jgi:hypothetical protein
MKRASKNNKKTDYFKLKTLTTKDIGLVGWIKYL